jgi:apolipoprotein N-acyltransferase
MIKGCPMDASEARPAPNRLTGAAAVPRRGGVRRFLGALALGVAAAGALPPFGVLPLAFLAIAGLLALLARAPSAVAAGLTGLAFGLGYHMAGLYWVTNAILVRAEEFWWAVPLAVPLLSFVLALFIAVPCALAWGVPAGWRRVGVLAGLWVLGDIARQFVLSGFPWNPLGSVWEMSGTLGLVFMQPAAWVGIDGLTLFTLLAAGSLTLGWRWRAAGMCLLLGWAGAGAWRLGVQPPASGMTAVIVQGNVSEEEHAAHLSDRVWANAMFERHLALTRQGVAKAGGAPVMVVWPETASPYALAQDPNARRAIAEAAAPARMTLSGTIRWEGDTIAHNSMVAVAPDGALAGFYDKAHLVPFGEYFPSYAHVILGEQGFVPGPGVRTLHLPGLPPLGPLICYEAIFSGQVVNPTDRPAILVNITNDAWFGDSAGPRQHLAAARMRSVEEGLPMVRAANTGISAVIDAHGRVLDSMALDETGVLVAAVPGALPQTLAGRLKLWGPGLLSLLCAGVAAVNTRRLSRTFKKIENSPEKRKLY